MAFVRKTEAGRFRGVAKRGRVVLGSRTFDKRKDALAWAERLEAAADGGVDVRAGRHLPWGESNSVVSIPAGFSSS